MIERPSEESVRKSVRGQKMGNIESSTCQIVQNGRLIEDEVNVREYRFVLLSKSQLLND